MLSFAVRVLLATVALALASTLGGGAMVLLFGDLGFPQPESEALPWQIASWAISAATLVWLAYRSRPRGWILAASLALLLFGIAQFNSMIEARFFGLLTSDQLFAILAMSAISTILFGLALIPVLSGVPPLSGGDGTWAPRITALRVIAGAFAYLCFYFVAGIAILPYIEDFYSQRPMPSGLHVILMQLVIRGPVFVALAALFVRMSGAGRLETSLLTGAALSLLGGVATLIVPNAFIPDATRWAHLVEVGTSNFLYGWLVGWLLTTRAVPSTATVQPPAIPAVS